MKLRNKKTGEIEHYGICLDKMNSTGFGRVDYCYDTIEELNENWEDVKPIEFLKYYLINEKTGYIATFDNEREMKIFQSEIDGWKPVKVLLDGEKYTIDRICEEE